MTSGRINRVKEDRTLLQQALVIFRGLRVQQAETSSDYRWDTPRLAFGLERASA